MHRLSLAFLLATVAFARDVTIWIGTVELKIGMDQKLALGLLAQAGDLRKTEFGNETRVEHWTIVQKKTNEAIGDVFFEGGRLHQATQYLNIPQSKETLEIFRDLWEATSAEIPIRASGGPPFGRGAAGITMREFGGIHGKQYSIEIHFVDTDRTLELLLTEASKLGPANLWIGKRVTGE